MNLMGNLSVTWWIYHEHHDSSLSQDVDTRTKYLLNVKLISSVQVYFWGCISPRFSFQQWANESTILVGLSIHMKYILLADRSTTMIMGIASSLCSSYLREWEDQHQKMRMSVMFGSEKNKWYKFVNCSDMGPQGILTTCISVKPGQTRGKRLKNFQSIEFCNPCLRSNQSPNLQTAEELFIPTDDFLPGALRLIISYHFPWMRRKNSTRPLLLPGWYAISAKRPDISWWQSHLVDTPTTCRVCVGWWIEIWRNYNKGMIQTVAPSNMELPKPVLSWDSYPLLALLTVESPYSMAGSGTDWLEIPTIYI